MCETSSRTGAVPGAACVTPCGVPVHDPQDTTNSWSWSQVGTPRRCRRSNRRRLPTSERRWPGSRTSARVAARPEGGRDGGRRIRRHRARIGPARARGRRARARDAAAAAVAPGRAQPGRPRRRPRRDRPARPAGERRRPLGPAPPGPQPVRRGGPAVGDGRGRRGAARGLAAPVPVRLDLGRPAVRLRRGAARQRRAGRLRRRRPGPPARPGFGPARVPGRGGGGPALPRRARAGRDRHRQPRRRPRPRRPGQRRAVGAAGRARDVRLPASQRGPGPQAGRRLVHAAARRLPGGDRDRDRPHGVQRHAGTPPDPPVPGPRRRLPAGAAGADGHGLGTQGGRPDDPAAPERVRRPPLLRHRRVQHDAAAPAGGGRRRRARDDGHGPPVRAGRLHPGGDGAGAGAGRGGHPGDPLGQRGAAARACRSRPADAGRRAVRAGLRAGRRGARYRRAASPSPARCGTSAPAGPPAGRPAPARRPGRSGR